MVMHDGRGALLLRLIVSRIAGVIAPEGHRRAKQDAPLPHGRTLSYEASHRPLSADVSFALLGLTIL
jgi:hypothetical protein